MGYYGCSLRLGVVEGKTYHDGAIDVALVARIPELVSGSDVPGSYELGHFIFAG